MCRGCAGVSRVSVRAEIGGAALEGSRSRYALYKVMGRLCLYIFDSNIVVQVKERKKYLKPYNFLDFPRFWIF